MESFAGFVLAGGRSTRMGRDKALLELAGEPLIARGLRMLGEVCAEVAIAGGGPELARFGRVIADARPGCGPLGGLVAALEQSMYEWNVFVPVDVPFVPASVWIDLVSAAERSGALAALVVADGRVQPLCGAYARGMAPGLRAALEAGTLKVRLAAEAAGGVELVSFEQVEWFRNFNTPEEFAGIALPRMNDGRDSRSIIAGKGR